MYTIGQVANIMGISKDKLRYYEEKGVLKPSQNNENNYRQYSLEEMISILSIEFYRSLDLDFKNIKRIHNQSDIKDIEEILEEKRNETIKEVDRLNAIVSRIDKAKKACNDIERYLNKFSIRPMQPIKVLGEISDFTAFNEFEVIHENRAELEDEAIIKSMKRYLTFNDDRVVSNKMFITKEIEESKDKYEGNILEYGKCIYTIVEDGLDYKNVMEDTFEKVKEWVYANNYKVKGEGIIGMILIEHFHEKVRSYLEIYIPIE